MYLPKFAIIFLVVTFYQIRGQFIKIDNNSDSFVKFRVLTINNCNKKIQNSNCIDLCNFTDFKNLRSFQEKEEHFTRDLQIVKYDSNTKVLNEEKIKNFPNQKVFLVSNNHINYRLVIPEVLNKTIYIFNNETVNTSCRYWMVNLNLTSKLQLT